MTDLPRLDQLLALLGLALILLLRGALPVASLVAPPIEVKVEAVAPLPVWVGGVGEEAQASNGQAALALGLSAHSVWVSDAETGIPLLALNPDLPLAPASTVKMMTALVSLEKYPWELSLRFTPAQLRSSSLPVFWFGEEVTVGNLLSALLLTSSNNAAQLLADAYPAGYLGFIQRMNTRARQLGMTETRFVDPIGFDQLGQVTTAQDLELLADAFMAEPLLAEIVSQAEQQIGDISGRFQHQLTNTNQLLTQLPGQVRGIKTGTTPEAGEVLVAEVLIQERPVRIIIMGSQDRYGDAQKIINWVQEHYHWHLPAQVVPQ